MYTLSLQREHEYAGTVAAELAVAVAASSSALNKQQCSSHQLFVLASNNNTHTHLTNLAWYTQM
jgi:hypothetical protein